MTDGNYIVLFSALGKLCYIYDEAAASEADMQLLGERTMDQIATGEVVSWELTRLVGAQLNSLQASIQAGPTAIIAWAKNAAEIVLKSETVKAFFLVATVPSSPTAVQMLTALQTEMATAGGGDDKTLTTSGATGLVNFFDTLWVPGGSWNTEASADYPDSTYVVATIV